MYVLWFQVCPNTSQNTYKNVAKKNTETEHSRSSKIDPLRFFSGTLILWGVGTKIGPKWGSQIRYQIDSKIEVQKLSKTRFNIDQKLGPKVGVPFFWNWRYFGIIFGKLFEHFWNHFWYPCLHHRLDLFWIIFGFVLISFVIYFFTIFFTFVSEFLCLCLLFQRVDHEQKRCKWRKPVATSNATLQLTLPRLPPITRSGGIWWFLVVSGGTWRYLAVSGGIWRYLAVSGGIWRYLVEIWRSGGIGWYLAWSNGIWRYLRDIW